MIRVSFSAVNQLLFILRDPHTLVELSAFSAINRFQPFNVAVSSNVLLLMVRKNSTFIGDQRRSDSISAKK